MAPVKSAASRVQKNRVPVAADNPYLAMQETLSDQIVAGLNAWRDAAEAIAERTFLSVYGSPVLQAACGIDTSHKVQPRRRAATSPLHRQLVDSRIAELKSQIKTGGVRECVVRACLYVGMARKRVDERGFELVRQMRSASSDHEKLSPGAFKKLVREQFFMLLIDEEAALAAVPSLLPQGMAERRAALEVVRKVMRAVGEVSGEAKQRLKRVTSLFDEQRPYLMTVEARAQM